MRRDLDLVSALRGAIGGVARNAFSITLLTCMRRTIRSNASSDVVSLVISSTRRTLMRGAGRQSLILCRQRGHERRECSHMRSRHRKQIRCAHGMVHHTARSNSSRHTAHSLIYLFPLHKRSLHILVPRKSEIRVVQKGATSQSSSRKCVVVEA